MSKSINRAYSEIYKDYDLVNSVFSFGTMKLWRKVAAKEAVMGGGRLAILDIATGTGELAFEIIKAAGGEGKVRITGMDFNSRMLDVAKRKARDRGLEIKFEKGDATNLRYADNHFDVLVSGFALKNIDDLRKFSGEAHRVLKSGGRFVFLDMASPDSRIVRLIIGTYWSAMGRAFAIVGKDAYIKIIGSINEFDKNGFVETLKETGFKQVKISRPIFGPAFLITGRK